jgi:hypothetical protein
VLSWLFDHICVSLGNSGLRRAGLFMELATINAIPARKRIAYGRAAFMLNFERAKAARVRPGESMMLPIC